MVTVAYQRPDKTGREQVAYNVHKGGKKLADTVAETAQLGSKIHTDKYRAYKSIEKWGYEHETVNHSEVEYAACENNEIHTNDCECPAGLLKWWQKKHQGVSKHNLDLYTKSCELAQS